MAYNTSLGNVSSNTSHASFSAILYELTSFFTLFFANSFPNRLACRCNFTRTTGILHTLAASLANFLTKHLYGAAAATSSATRPVIVGRGLLDANPRAIAPTARKLHRSSFPNRPGRARALQSANRCLRTISPAHTHAATSGPRRLRALRNHTTRAA